MLLIFCLFFAASSTHALEYLSRSYQLSGPDQKSMALRISSRVDEIGTLTLSADSNEVFTSPINRGELLGICLEKGRDNPSFIMTEVLEGVGLEQAYVLSKNTDWQLRALNGVKGISSVDELAACYRAASNWTANGEAIRCECDFGDVLKQQLAVKQWHDLFGEYQTGLYLNESTSRLRPRVIGDTIQVERLLAQARADKAMTYEVTIAERQWAIVEHKDGIYGSVSIGMLKQGKHWFVWYYVLGNSKSFSAINNIDRLSVNIISATLCIEGCDWWGKLVDVDINLDTLQLQVIDRE
jgi:hypothetical protein